MICITLTNTTTEDLLSSLKENEKEADIIEIRLDFQEDLTAQNLKNTVDEIIKNKTKPVIFTVRSKKEGGNFPDEVDKQVEILLYCAEKGAEYLDIELSWPSKTYKYMFKKKNKSKIIASYHNFKKTPSIYGLKKIARRLAWTKADILKIATWINEYTEIQDLFSTIDFIKNRYKLATICLGMGEKGLISRVMQKEMGGYLTFLCPENSENNGIGQIEVKDYFDIRKKIKLN